MRKIPPYQGGVSKFNILAHRLGFRTYGEGAVRMVQHHPQATTQMSRSDTLTSLRFTNCADQPGVTPHSPVTTA